MKKKITKPEMKLLKLQKMNVIATSGAESTPAFTLSKQRGFDMSNYFE